MQVYAKVKAHQQQLQKEKQRFQELEQKWLRLLRFENSFYKVSIISKRRDISTITSALETEGFYIHTPIGIKRKENLCLYFTKKNPPPKALLEKVDYIIKILNRHVKVPLRKKRIDTNNENAIKIELLGQ